MKRHRTQAIALLAACFVAGALGLVTLKYIRAEREHVEDYAPPHEPQHRIRVTATAPTASENTAPTSRQRVISDGRPQIVGRVILHDGTVPEACEIEIHPAITGAAPGVKVVPDAEGYFESGPLALVPHEVVARAPNACMLPATPRIAMPEDDPVRIYMHRVVGAHIRVWDSMAGLPAALPFGSPEVLLGDSALPRNGANERPELLASAETQLLQEYFSGRLIVRMLGTEREVEWRRNPLAQVKMRRPTMQVPTTTVELRPLQEAIAATPTFVEAQPLPGYRRVVLRITYASGGTPSYQGILQVYSAQGAYMHGYNAPPMKDGRVLVYMQPGKWIVAWGHAAGFMQHHSLHVTRDDFQEHALVLERGGDVSIGVGSPTSPIPFQKLTVAGQSNESEEAPEMIFHGWQHAAKAINDMPEGRYRVRLTDVMGREHERELFVRQGTEASIWF